MMRLGVNGAQDIKNHPFFSKVDWNDVVNKKTFPPEQKQKTVKRESIALDKFVDSK